MTIIEAAANEEMNVLRAKLAECEREIERLNTVCDTYDYENQRLFYRAERLEAAIRDAPHADDCSSHNAPIAREVNQFGKLVEWEQFNECDCWKRDALEGKQ